ncbi:MAG: hypothetical protein ABEI57_00285 [Halapricum sp.]
MAIPLKPLLIVLGIVLATTGVFIYRKALYGFGGLLGGAGGGLVGVAIGADLLVFALAILLGVVVGIWLILTAYRMAILAAGAITGLAVGMYVAGASLTAPGSLADPIVGIGLVLGLIAGWVLKKVIVVVVSAAWGASLVSIGLAPQVNGLTNVKAIVDAFVSPWLYAVFVGGIVVQIGLWAYLHYYAGDDEEDDPDSGFLGGLVGW